MTIVATVPVTDKNDRRTDTGAQQVLLRSTSADLRNVGNRITLMQYSDVKFYFSYFRDREACFLFLHVRDDVVNRDGRASRFTLISRQLN